ncbi:DUF4860 domain-containing protein [Candidatus Soleaferrea massiliensis]|uniref:DUF4860 domain-containing protein n=1 Tax=Candidatus Soleaferrea massiliensis TaxID=1470354 RepID=UPI000590F06A|nr:DUF4860 domain-containing protein [Candidatus Soleaferrea massiliensis]
MRSRSHSIDVLFSFVLFGLFTVLSFMLVLIGANVYSGVVKASDGNDEVRASLSYVSNKVRAENRREGIRVEERSGVRTLVISQEIEGRTYETLIYYYDGSLREILRRPDQSFDPSRGQEIAELKSFDVSENEQKSLLTLTIMTTQDREYTSRIALQL